MTVNQNKHMWNRFTCCFCYRQAVQRTDVRLQKKAMLDSAIRWRVVTL